MFNASTEFNWLGFEQMMSFWSIKMNPLVTDINPRCNISPSLKKPMIDQQKPQSKLDFYVNLLEIVQKKGWNGSLRIFVLYLSISYSIPT